MELNRSSAIDRIQSRILSIDEFNFDHLSGPPIASLFTQQDLDRLYEIATSIRYSGNARKRLSMIDEVMKPRGFIKLSAGTNRICYRFLEDDSFVAKVAIDAIGINDNPSEFRNQFIFKPFVTKIFEVDKTGVLAIAERVIPVTSREEFYTIADNIYDLINEWFIGKYVLADIGVKFFMNYGIRSGFGPVLLDYPYIYELDGNKLYCSEPDINSPTGRCEGLIDYDDGFNFLYCSKCNKRYRVQELAKAIKNESIIIKGRRTNKMIVSVSRNGVKVIEAKETDGLLKPATNKIELASNVEVKPATGLTTSVKVEAKPVNNSKGNHTRKNDRKPNNNRGIVRNSDSGNSIKVSVGSNKHTTKEEIKKDPVIKMEEYDAETGVLIISVDGKKVSISIYMLPEELKESIIESSEELTNALMDIHTLEENVNKLNSDLSEIKAINEALESDKKDLEERLVAAEDKLDDTIIDKLKKEVSDLTDRLRKSEEVKSDDVSILHQKNEQIESLESTLEEKNAEMLILEDENRNLQKTIGDLTEQLTSASDDTDLIEANKQISSLNKEINSLKDQLAKVSEDLEKANEKIAEYDNNTEAEEDTTPRVNRVSLPSKFEDDYETYEKYAETYPHISPINGVITTINGLLAPDQESFMENHKVIVFSNGDGGYFVDQDNQIISMISINGVSVDDLFAISPINIEENKSDDTE